MPITHRTEKVCQKCKGKEPKEKAKCPQCFGKGIYIETIELPDLDNPLNPKKPVK